MRERMQFLLRAWGRTGLHMCHLKACVCEALIAGDCDSLEAEAWWMPRALGAHPPLISSELEDFKNS